MSNIFMKDLRDYWRNVSDWVKGTDTKSKPKVSDEAVLAKLAELDKKVNGIINGTTPANTRSTGNRVGYSTETKPTGKEGDSFYELDTGKVFLSNGAIWTEIQ